MKYTDTLKDYDEEGRVLKQPVVYEIALPAPTTMGPSGGPLPSGRLLI